MFDAITIIVMYYNSVTGSLVVVSVKPRHSILHDKCVIFQEINLDCAFTSS